jgi:hypothetical protein
MSPLKVGGELYYPFVARAESSVKDETRRADLRTQNFLWLKSQPMTVQNHITSASAAETAAVGQVM